MSTPFPFPPARRAPTSFRSRTADVRLLPTPAPRLPHVARPEFAGKVLESIEAHVATVLTAAPNKGKTRFVDGDIVPALVARGYRVVRATLVRWAVADRGLDLAFHGEPDALNPFARVSVAGGQPGARTVYILEGFDSLDPSAHAEAMASARAVLESTRDRLLFLTVSVDSREAIFEAEGSPWASWAQEKSLPEFDYTYVAERLQLVSQRTGIQIGLPQAARLFARIDRMPGLFDWLVLDAMVNGSSDLEASLLHWAAEVFPTHFQPELEQLQGLDHALLRTIAACGAPALYSRATQEALQEHDAEPVTSNRIKDALRRLTALRLVESTGSRGQYRLMPSVMWVGIREHARSRFANRDRRTLLASP